MKIIVLGLPNEGKSTIADIVARALTQHDIRVSVNDPDEPQSDLWNSHRERREAAVSERLRDQTVEIEVMQQARRPTVLEN
jgi:adenylylsulfate kinase-like enzyme